jgi:hypothetical protein
MQKLVELGRPNGQVWDQNSEVRFPVKTENQAKKPPAAKGWWLAGGARACAHSAKVPLPRGCRWRVATFGF